MREVTKRLQRVRDALSDAGKGLSPADWKELLEEIGADVEGHLDAVRDENEDL